MSDLEFICLGVRSIFARHKVPVSQAYICDEGAYCEWCLYLKKCMEEQNEHGRIETRYCEFEKTSGCGESEAYRE